MVVHIGVRTIIEDRNRNYWLSNILNRYNIIQDKTSPTEKKILKYNKLKGIERSSKQVRMKFPYFLSAVTDNENKDLWMVTYSEGVWRYDGKNLFHYPIKDGETDVLLSTIYKDNQGSLWLGTQNAGVLKFNGKTFDKFEPLKK